MLWISIQFILIPWNKPSGRVPILCPHREKQIYKKGQGCSGSESITRDAPLFWCPGHAPEQARGTLVESKHLCFWRLTGDFHVQSRFRCIKIPLGFSSTGSSRKWYGNDFWRSAGLPWFSGDTWLRWLCLSGEVQTPPSPGDTLWEGRTSNRVSVNFSVLFSRCGWLVPSPRTEPLTTQELLIVLVCTFLASWGEEVTRSRGGDLAAMLAYHLGLNWSHSRVWTTDFKYQHPLGVYWKYRFPASTLDPPSLNQHLNEAPEGLLTPGISESEKHSLIQRKW